jgi:ATP-binding cassette subfamily F protein uup
VNLLRMARAEVAYGERKLLDRASLVLDSGEKVALIGRNGAGKSTLLKVLAGEILIDDGEIWLDDTLTVSTLAQDVTAAGEQSVYHTVTQGLGELGDLLDRYHHVTQQGTAQALQALGDIEAGIEALGGWNVEQRVTRMLERMALPADVLMADCSGGMQRRALLAQALVAEPDLLLLDEPTNHLDIPNIDALQQLLVTTPATVVFVSHDRALVDSVATRIVEVDRGRLTSYPGNYATYRERKQKAAEEEVSANRKFDQELAREESWIREGIKARRTRNEGRVRRLQGLRSQRAARVDKQGNVRLDIDAGKQSGALVAELENVSFGYESVLIRDFTTRVMRGDRVGIIGPNGSGKSTLLRLLLGELQPQQGRATLGTRLQTAYFDQQRSHLDERLTIRQSVGEGSDTISVGGRERHVVGYLGDFLFPSAQLNQPVGSLSGGEKNRLLMAKLFAQPANLLVLDEPTNDLDVETLELLEELLSEFSGTLLLVSHDRAFLDAVVTSTIVFEADGRLAEYVGGYSDWQARLNRVKVGESTARARKSKKRAPNQVKKLGFKEQRELAALPDQIESLEATQVELQSKVSGTNFYQQAPDAIQAGLDALREVALEIEQAYERWEALSERDGGGA